MNVKSVLTKLEIYKEAYCPPLETYYKIKKIVFEQKSYERSAVDEIKKYIINNGYRDCISVMEEFRSMVDDFACKSTDGDTGFMFSVYYDVATDVLDMLLERGYYNG